MDRGTARPPRSVLLSILAALSVPACFGEDSTIFPSGLEPLEESRAPAPSTADDPTPELLSVVSGEGREFGWAHARGFVRRDLATTWAALRTPEVTVDRRQVAEWSVVPDTEPEYPFSYAVDNVVKNIVTVRFRVGWRHGPAEGTVDAPEVVAARWQKTEGTVLISILRGSIVAREVAEGVTELAMVEHIEAASGGVSQIETYLRDLFESVRARAHGRPLPTYDD
jgi:hypothetical protein